MIKSESVPTEKPRAKRGSKERGTLQLLNGVKVSGEDLLRDIERTIQAARQDMSRQTKKWDAIQAILQQNLDIRGQLRRMWNAIPEGDRGKLEAVGYFGPRKDKA